MGDENDYSHTISYAPNARIHGVIYMKMNRKCNHSCHRQSSIAQTNKRMCYTKLNVNGRRSENKRNINSKYDFWLSFACGHRSLLAGGYSPRYFDSFYILSQEKKNDGTQEARSAHSST